MAEIQAAAAPSRSNKPRAKKHAFRLDMTPMVDLAFLLLTFFMLTTTFAKPAAMQLTMPANGDPTSTPASKSLTLILGKNNQVFYFEGLNEDANPAHLRTTGFGAAGLRQVLLRQLQRQPLTTVLIKASDEASYQNLVDALDEMTITGQKKYALVDLDGADRALLQKQVM
ncbi:biopolymer transporter ExbD [Hymenobacter busanensis]|uniref:Biopolymer transporter ExbD n=1 Tax=Hymenobacter busanensis TaxID=2607656 RepID=A0A7L4ZYL1_9BACT|nr:biopolymer transporter ExbD [Hymenobacter busanensis]KAA9333186.1 biopolymer transporter ExbD [Hymenobacter busanensis]QHJ08137.1 biopolymer transporter ExbD [Hymenobacter busanensis]